MNTFQKIDAAFINWSGRISVPFGRFAIFLIYFWFGILKILDTSPANELVRSLMEKTLPFMTFGTFIVLFAIFEMAIGILFLIPRFNRLALLLLAAHMVMTMMPLVLLPAMAWQSSMTPTLEGQYMIKNIVIIGLALCIAAKLPALKRDKIK